MSRLSPASDESEAAAHRASGFCVLAMRYVGFTTRSRTCEVSHLVRTFELLEEANFTGFLQVTATGTSLAIPLIQVM